MKIVNQNIYNKTNKMGQKMGVFVIALLLCVLTQNAVAQTIGKTKTESYQADFEKKKDISA